MYRYCIVVIFLLIGIESLAQKKLTPAQKKFADSVNRALVGQADSIKHQILITLFEKNRNRSYNRSMIVGKKAIPFVRKRGDLQKLAALYLNLGQLECKSGEDKASLPYYREAARIYRSLGQPTVVADVYQDLAICSEKKGDFEIAFRYQNLARNIRDSIRDETQSRRYNELLAKYELEKSEKDSKIAEQQQQLLILNSNSREDYERNKQIIVAEAIAIGVLFILLMGVLYTRSKFRRNLIAERSARQTEKRERMQISKDIHDDLDSELSKINALSQSMVDKPGALENRKNIFSIMEISTSLLVAMKDLVWQLNIENSTLENLITKIREHASQHFADSPIEVVGTYPDSVQELYIQRISFHNIIMVVKEVLHNISKHSKAMNVGISITIENDRLHITIADDGVGFDRTLEGRGDGINHMHSRMKVIGGLMNIVSEPNNGTKVTIDIGLIQIARKN
ncbi:MAG TPA: tetratricopeptide repeat protein [Chryseosolibacter sp.]